MSYTQTGTERHVGTEEVNKSTATAESCFYYTADSIVAQLFLFEGDRRPKSVVELSVGLASTWLVGLEPKL